MMFNYSLLEYTKSKSASIHKWLLPIYEITLEEKYYLQVIFQVLSEFKTTAIGNQELEDDIIESIDELITVNKYLNRRSVEEKEVVKNFLLSQYTKCNQDKLDNMRGEIFEALLRDFIPIEVSKSIMCKIYNEPKIYYNSNIVGDEEHGFDIIYDHKDYTEYIECKININNFLTRGENVDDLANKESTSKKCKNARKLKYMKTVFLFFDTMKFSPPIYIACLNSPNDEEKSNDYLEDCKYGCIKVVGKQKLFDFIYSK